MFKNTGLLVANKICTSQLKQQYANRTRGFPAGDHHNLFLLKQTVYTIITKLRPLFATTAFYSNNIIIMIIIYPRVSFGAVSGIRNFSPGYRGTKIGGRSFTARDDVHNKRRKIK